MREFNLEKALAGAKVCTRDGREVTEIHYFKTARKDGRTIVTVLDGELRGFYEDGHICEDHSESLDDLFLAPTKKTYWVNVYKYPDDDLFHAAKLMFTTKSDAEQRISDSDHYIGTFPIEILE